MKKTLALVLAILIASVNTSIVAFADETPVLNIKAECSILMEASSGKILYENNSHVELPPASITKIMTMLLAMEAIEDGHIKIEDIVTVSKTAAIKKGSHVFLAPEEKISVSDLLKAIAVASGNDAAIAMAEYISGTEGEFVSKMNERAVQLGMKNTHFINSNGLDVKGHYSSAYDIAIMTKELLKHPLILNYTTIWMDTLRNGTFDLANTNKLIKFYSGANGMKTGSTTEAKYCISATAKREGMQLIAVVLASPSTKDRFADASTLLNYGFANYAVVNGKAKGEDMGAVTVKKGMLDKVDAIVKDDFSMVIQKSQQGKIEEKIELANDVSAPVEQGQKLGEIVLKIGDKELGRVDVIANENIDKLSFPKAMLKLLNSWLAFNKA